MALRNILIEGDPILRKKSRPVTEWNERLKILAADMQETMKANSGVGLAAPQVGVLRRIFVMNLGTEEAEDIVAINPRIIEQEGAEVGEEGCLSLPGLVGNVERPQRILLEAENLAGDTFRLELTGLGAVCACHEIDHLDGILYRDKSITPLVKASRDSEDTASGEV